MAKTTPANGSANFRYLKLADEMERKITGGIYQAGEKLPSLRKLHGRTGCSITTVYQAYIELEKRGVVAPRQKSGFFVQPLLKDILPLPEKTAQPTAVPHKVAINRLIESLHTSLSDAATLQLGGAMVAAELLPYKALFKSVLPATDHKLKKMIATYEHPIGNFELRRQIAKRIIGQSMTIAPEDIIITNGCMEAISICLRAVAKPGDTILVESPTFHCFLQLIEDLDMFALELSVDPQHGLDLKDLKRAVGRNKISACILMPNFQNPTGFVMADDCKKMVVDFLATSKFPLSRTIYTAIYFSATPDRHP
jgi:DNA-binding transcriptional MocR family regulator